MERKPLQYGYPLEITDRDQNHYTIVVNETIGYGGSCIVYKGKKIAKVGASRVETNVVVKECYPQNLNLDRGSDGKIIPVDSASGIRFEREKNFFSSGQESHIRFYELLSNMALPRPFIYGESNNTLYAVSDGKAGTTLADIDRKSLTINRIAEIMGILCEEIGRIHFPHHFLYLDCKPENFFHSYENGRESIHLFDFDTIVPLEKIRKKKYEFCAYSYGWAAPEQLPDEQNRYYCEEKIGIKTDLFSLGMVFFWLLTGRKAIYGLRDHEELDTLQKKTFKWNGECDLVKEFFNAEPETISLIVDILSGLSAFNSDERRYEDTEALKNDFIRLKNQTARITISRREYDQLLSPDNQKIVNAVAPNSRISAIRAYSQVWTDIDKLFLRPDLTRFKRFFYEDSDKLPNEEDIDIGIALSLRIRDGIQYSQALLPFISASYRESHFEYQKQIMNAKITQLSLQNYTFDWEQGEHPLLEEKDVSVESIVAYSKYWTDMGEVFLERKNAKLRKFFFESADKLPESEEEFEAAKVLAEMYRDTMMYSELLLDNIPYEFRRSYNVFKRRIMASKIIGASMENYSFKYEKEQGF